MNEIRVGDIVQHGNAYGKVKKVDNELIDITLLSKKETKAELAEIAFRERLAALCYNAVRHKKVILVHDPNPLTERDLASRP
jgi:hypothetical protein